jgi:dTDP-4-amino-4,6-dideoxygalactose transaminase
MNNNGVNCAFHYVPLHSSPAGRIYGRTHGELEVTNDVSDRLIRLPLWSGMSDAEFGYVLNHTIDNL